MRNLLSLTAFGLSDHVTTVVKPRAKMQDKPVKSMTKSRDMRPSNVRQ